MGYACPWWFALACYAFGVGPGLGATILFMDPALLWSYSGVCCSMRLLKTCGNCVKALNARLTTGLTSGSINGQELCSYLVRSTTGINSMKEYEKARNISSSTGLRGECDGLFLDRHLGMPCPSSPLWPFDRPHRLSRPYSVLSAPLS